MTQYEKLARELIWIVRLEDAVCELSKVDRMAYRKMTEDQRIPLLRQAIEAMGHTPGRMTSYKEEQK